MYINTEQSWTGSCCFLSVVMYKFGVVIVSVLAFSSAFGVGIPVSDSDPLAKVKEIIRQANLDLAKEHMSVFSAEDFSMSDWYWEIMLTGFRLGNFSTIDLVGDKQVFTPTIVGDSTVYEFEVQIGFQELFLEGDIYLWFLFPMMNSHIRIAESKDNHLGVMFKGSIAVKNDGTCSPSMDSAKVTGVEQVEVTLTGGGITGVILKYTIQLLLNYYSPQLESTVNYELSDSLKLDDFKNNFRKIACAPFVN